MRGFKFFESAKERLVGVCVSVFLFGVPSSRGSREFIFWVSPFFCKASSQFLGLGDGRQVGSKGDAVSW